MKQLIPPSPCRGCHREADGKTCSKPVNPDAKTTCQKWNEWYRESWKTVTRLLKGER